MIKKRIIAILQFLLFLGLGLFLVWWMIRGIDADGWIQIRQSLKKAKYWLFLPVLLILLLSHYVRALRWSMLMEPLGYKPSKWNVFHAVMIGYLANLAFPRLGEVLKCTILSKYEHAAPDKLVGTIVAERAIDLICLLVVFLLTFLSQMDVVGTYAATLLREWMGDGGASYTLQAVVYLLVVIAVLFFVSKWLLKRFENIIFIQKIRTIIEGVGKGLLSIRYVKHKKIFLFQTLLIWLLYFAAARVGFYAMDEVAHLGFVEALSILFFGSIGMIVTQGGLGAYAYAVQETLVWYNIPTLIGFTFGWILWIAQTGVILLGGLVSMILLPLMNRKQDES